MVGLTATESRNVEKGVFGAALLAGPANVVMQLSWPGVGYGVMESRVTSGRVDLHPIKRQRTTLTYLAVVALGTDEERQIYKKAVDTSHRQVFDDENSRSPVKYHGMNPDLQLWVAACLYRGIEDVYEVFWGGIPEDEREEVYRNSHTLGTTLQVRESMWPATREEFDAYWEKGLDEVRIDDAVREYLMGVVEVRHFPLGLTRPFAGLNRFITTGFLPQRFRDEMQLPWSDAQQRRWDRLMTVVGWVTRRTPRLLREYPFNYYLWDFRRRVRAGRPLV